MFLLLLSIAFILATVSTGDGPESKSFKDMEVRIVVKCHIPGAVQTKFNVTLMEENRGRNAWFNADRPLNTISNATFMQAYYLKGMMHPEIDRVLEPYLLINHRCDMKNRNVEGCYRLPKNEDWPDVFPPPYFHDTGSINVDELVSSSEMASWFGWGGSSTPADSGSAPSTSDVAPELRLYGDDLRPSGHASFAAGNPQQQAEAAPPTIDYSPAPVLALDQLKHAGVPLNRQMTPYLQIDPSMFAASQPQYVMPDGGVAGKGRFEFALGHIGWAVAGGFGVGSMRGALPEMLDKDTKTLRGKPWLTRMANATVKHGSGFAQPAGVLVFMYSVLEIGMRQLRADDDLNSIGAGGLAGAIYRSPHGARAMAIGTGVGTALATAWVFFNEDSRERMVNMFSK